MKIHIRNFEKILIYKGLIFILITAHLKQKIKTNICSKPVMARVKHSLNFLPRYHFEMTWANITFIVYKVMS